MQRLSGLVSTLLILAYPLVMWLADRSDGDRLASLTLLAILLAYIAARLLPKDRLLPWLGVVVLFVVLAPLVPEVSPGEGRYLLLMPVVINAGLLASFGLSLAPGRTPAVERFARMIRPDLDEPRVAYCRKVTVVWCVFFLLNGIFTLYLAFFRSVSEWAVYTGVISYVLILFLFAGEYAVRRYRFR